jgi:hypothetical protein
VAIAAPLCSMPGWSSVVVVTGSSIPCPDPPQHLSGAPDIPRRPAHGSKLIAHGRYTNPPSASVNGAELQPTNFNPTNAAPSPGLRPVRIYAAAAFSSQPAWPQWQLSVIIFFVSSQCREQYFLPTGAMQVQAICAHLMGATGVVDIVPPQSDQAPIFQECQNCTRKPWLVDAI